MYEKNINNYLFSADKTKLQLNVIHSYLSYESYWAKNIPVELVSESISGSICFGVYTNNNQIGYARVITDNATFGYLADVFIIEEHRGKGLSKELMRFIMDFPALKKLRRFMLATKDAHGLYKQFGFNALAKPENIMEIKFFESY
ncbi:MAG: GNAT family N-acetyltransferase [Bacteroidota bacterium]|nr:GNAT family N-acetyltransferase [Bacteroidota bacterium]MDP3143953.1 GNAT family N-acetyltransferase [Bacteroidota bacterium]